MRFPNHVYLVFEKSGNHLTYKGTAFTKKECAAMVRSLDFVPKSGQIVWRRYKATPLMGNANEVM